MGEHGSTSVQILKDVFDGIEHFYGKQGLDQIADYAMLRNRTRESNKLMDELEVAFGPFDMHDLAGLPGTPGTSSQPAESTGSRTGGGE